MNRLMHLLVPCALLKVEGNVGPGIDTLRLVREIIDSFMVPVTAGGLVSPARGVRVPEPQPQRRALAHRLDRRAGRT